MCLIAAKIRPERSPKKPRRRPTRLHSFLANSHRASAARSHDTASGKCHPDAMDPVSSARSWSGPRRGVRKRFVSAVIDEG